LRALGKCDPAAIAARALAPGKIFRIRQKLPGDVGKYFHFSEKTRAKNPIKPRKKLVHAGTAQS